MSLQDQSNRHRETVNGAIEPPWKGLRRVLPVHTAPPNPDNPEPLWLWLLPASGRHYPQVQGAALPPPSLRTKTISLISANRHPYATPVPYCGAACAQGRPML